MRLELVESVDIMNSVQSMLSGMDLNGPSTFCDTSLRLLAKIFDRRSHTAAGHGLDSAKGVCNWLRSSWTFGNLVLS